MPYCAGNGDAFALGKLVVERVGTRSVVAQARNVGLVGESQKTDDGLDARTLAWLVRVDPQLFRFPPQPFLQCSPSLRANA